MTITPYAREHKDECCLQFVTTVIGGWASDQDRDNPTFSFVTKPTVTDPEYRDQPEKVQGHILQFSENLKAVQSLAAELPNNFPKMLDKLISDKGVKEEDLAGTTNLSEKTIQWLRHHEQKSIGIETIVQLCIGLHLPPILSGYLLRAAGKHFSDTNLHNAYKFLLCSCYLYSVDECNALLEGQGYDTLGQKKKYFLAGEDIECPVKPRNGSTPIPNPVSKITLSRNFASIGLFFCPFYRTCDVLHKYWDFR